MSCLINNASGLFKKYVALAHGVSILFIIFLSACNNENATVVFYYPVDSLLTSQAAILQKEKASIRKVALMDKEESKIVFTPDSNAWVKELEIFRTLNMINKPIYRGAYQVTNEKDKKSNLTIKSYIAIKEDLPVEFLRVFYQGQIANIKKIEGRVMESNSMYEGERFLSMEFQDFKGKTFLSGYTVKGGQKMFLGDSVNYSIEAAISLPKR